MDSHRSKLGTSCAIASAFASASEDNRMDLPMTYKELTLRLAFLLSSARTVSIRGCRAYGAVLAVLLSFKSRTICSSLFQGFVEGPYYSEDRLC